MSMQDSVDVCLLTGCELTNVRLSVLSALSLDKQNSKMISGEIQVAHSTVDLKAHTAHTQDRHTL